MKIKFFLVSVLAFSCFASAFGQEGHPSWWWDIDHGSDLIIEGVVTYDQANYYELNPIKVEGKDKSYYWLAGQIRIKKILFINKNSQHLELYRELSRNLDQDCPVLIPAYKRIFQPTDSASAFILQPILGLDIPKATTIFNLSEINIYPILDLKLDSVVPPGNIGEAEGLIEKRANNYLK